MTKTRDLEASSSKVITTADERELEVQKILKKYAAIAASVAFVPVPLLDLAVLAGVQLKAIQEISKLHGKEFNEHIAKPVVTTAITTLSASPVARIGASLLKVVPVIGSALSIVAFPGYAAASTYAIGNLFDHHFTSGGTILDFDAKKAKESYKEFVNKYTTHHAETATA